MQDLFEEIDEDVEYDSVIERRLAFLLNEVKFVDATCDLSVRFTLRMLSNYFTTGQCNLSSEGVKAVNRYMSRGAEKLLHECRDKAEWNDLTTNEHPEPLSQTWEWMKSKGVSLSIMEIAKHIKRYPMVTVLKEEDQRIVANGHRSAGRPIERYKAAGISVTQIEMEPRYILRQARMNSRRLELRVPKTPYTSP
ncbi:MAG: hypothetical protein ACR650_08525 [Methylocystis sp.]